MKKKLLRTVMLFVILPALAIFVGSQRPAIAAKGQSLPPERKVREIELYVTTPDYDPIRYEFGLMTAEEWKKLGFDIKVTPLAWNRLSELGINQKDFDAFTLAWAGRAERIDPDHFVYMTLHSSQAGIGQYNIVGYNNPEYDKLAEEQRRVGDLKKRQEIVWKAQEIAAEDQPYLVIASRNWIVAYDSANFKNPTPMMGEALNAFWNWLSIEPISNSKEVVWGYPSDINTMNPLSSTATHDFQTTRLIYDRLVRIGPDGKPRNWAAESITQIDDTTYELKLRPGMKFHDGEPVKAGDVKFSVDLVRKTESPYFLGLIKPIAEVEIKDDLTLIFKLREPFAPFIANSLGQLYIFPEHIWSKVLEERGPKRTLEWDNAQAIGSGPFKLGYWRRDEEMKLIRNDDYFQPAKVDAIIKIPYANVQGLVAGLTTGEIDVLGWWLEPMQADKLKDVEGISVIEVPDHGYYHINVNMRRTPFDDKAVRFALSYAIPRQKIIDILLEGHGTKEGSIIASANSFWHNPAIKPLPYDLDKARQILKEAGYEWDAKGKIYYPEGKVERFNK